MMVTTERDVNDGVKMLECPSIDVSVPHNLSFFQFPLVLILLYINRKIFLYFFYNTAQNNTKLLQWTSDGKFSVFTLSYVNTALNQSSFRIHKFYIIIKYIYFSARM